VSSVAESGCFDKLVEEWVDPRRDFQGASTCLHLWYAGLRNVDPGSINTERRRSVLGIMLHMVDSHFMQPLLISSISKETSGHSDPNTQFRKQKVVTVISPPKSLARKL